MAEEVITEARIDQAVRFVTAMEAAQVEGMNKKMALSAALDTLGIKGTPYAVQVIADVTVLSPNFLLDDTFEERILAS